MLNTNLLEDFRNLKIFIILPPNLINIILNGVENMNGACKEKEKERYYLIHKSFQNWFPLQLSQNYFQIPTKDTKQDSIILNKMQKIAKSKSKSKNWKLENWVISQEALSLPSSARPC